MVGFDTGEDFAMADSERMTDTLALTTRIVSAHVANNSVTAESVPDLIRDVYRTLMSVGQEVVAPDRLVPAVPIKKSVLADHIVCLEDGKKLKMLKRHLKTAYNLSPEQYRVRWGLPSDYPMVAPDYARHRSVLARQIGLGRKPRRPV